MNPQAVVTVFMVGADVETIAQVANADSKQVQAVMRAELLRLAGQAQPSVSADAPLTTAKTAQAADSSPSPAPKNCAAAMKRSPARKAVAKAVASYDLEDYPLSLRDPKASRMRNIWAVLHEGPADFAEIESRLCLSADMDAIEGDIVGDLGKYVSNGMYALLQKALVVKPESPGGKWRLA